MTLSVRIRPVTGFVGVVLATSTLAACGSTPAPSPGSGGSGSSAPARQVGGDEKEVRTVAPRVVLAHDGDGITTLDAESGQVVDETRHPGFLRLANAGDGRHVLVADSDVFRVYDAGVSVQQHGDHAHKYTYTPGMTSTTYPAKHAGHVVLHHGLTTLFADGTGEIQVLDSQAVADPRAKVEKRKAPAAHHGVAFELSDGSLIRTEGTKDARSTVVVERDGKPGARTADCTGVHGEAAAQPTARGDVAVFGCENGPVVYRDGAFHKVKVKEPYARTGNLAGSETSPVVLSDYKVVDGIPEGAEPEHPTRVGLVDTRTDRIDLVDLGSSYWFRSLARGPHGEGIVLTNDGHLKVVDPTRKQVTRSVAVIGSWTEKKDWQEPGPAVKVAGDKAYVTDVAKKELVVVDLGTWKVEKRHRLEHTPIEMAVVTGRPEAPGEADHHGHEHGHAGGHSHQH